MTLMPQDWTSQVGSDEDFLKPASSFRSTVSAGGACLELCVLNITVRELKAQFQNKGESEILE